MLTRNKTLAIAFIAGPLATAFAGQEVGGEVQTSPERTPVAAGAFELGTPAPGLTVDSWVRGRPVESFELGRVYVVTFFELGSDASLVAIPGLSHLQKQFSDQGVGVVAVTGEDRQGATLADVESLVLEHGDRIAFSVAFDSGSSTRDAWLGGAGTPELPQSYVVDQEGNVVFAGKPEWLDLPLAAVAAGTWNLETGNAEIKRAIAAFEGVKKLGQRDASAALAAASEFESSHPGFAHLIAPVKFELLLDAERAEDAFELGAQVASKAGERGDYNTLNRVAALIVDPARELETRDLDLARRAAEKAVLLSGGKHSAILGTLALVHFTAGDMEKALEVQQRAVDAAPADDRAKYERTLERFQSYDERSSDGQEFPDGAPVRTDG